jgi:hypothetical protein
MKNLPKNIEPVSFAIYCIAGRRLSCSIQIYLPMAADATIYSIDSAIKVVYW